MNKNGWRNSTHWGALLSGPGYIFGSFLADKNLEFMTTVRDDVYTYLEQENSVLSTKYFTNKINALTNSIDKSYKLDVSRWGFRRDLYSLWKTETKRIISELPSRFATVHSNLASRGLTHTLEKSIVSKENQTIMIENPNQNANLYFTTDGSDPMGDDGSISSSAMNYKEHKNELDNTNTGYIIIRAHTQNNWGPKTIFQY